jgi:protein phosphatase
MLRISGTGDTHVGLVRADNEDSAFVGPTCILVADGLLLAAVRDPDNVIDIAAVRAASA